MVDSRLNHRVEKLLGLYRRRLITQNEAVNSLLRDLTPENLVELMAMLPHELQDGLKKWMDNAPTTDEEWQTVQFFWIGPGPDEAGKSQERAHLRRAAEGLRSFFERNR
jgi:hypothetical protein